MVEVKITTPLSQQERGWGRSQMKPRNIITGQKVSSEKKARLRELRKQMTPAEKILWQHLRAKRFNNLKFRRQQVIEGFLVDFYCHSLGLIIEVDGEIHGKQQEYDYAPRSLRIAIDKISL